MVYHETNAWGRVKYRIIDAPRHRASGRTEPCFEIRYADTNELKCWAITRDEAGRYIEGTLQGVIVE